MKSMVAGMELVTVQVHGYRRYIMYREWWKGGHAPAWWREQDVTECMSVLNIVDICNYCRRIDSDLTEV